LAVLTVVDNVLAQGLLHQGKIDQDKELRQFSDIIMKAASQVIILKVVCVCGVLGGVYDKFRSPVWPWWD